MVEAKRFEGVFLYKKKNAEFKNQKIGWYTKLLCATEYQINLKMGVPLKPASDLICLAPTGQFRMVLMGVKLFPGTTEMQKNVSKNKSALAM